MPEKLLGAILRSVSRSFYISIRLLPGRLRQPVGLGYLLARTTDTIADTGNIPASVRKEALGAVSSAIQTDGPAHTMLNLGAFVDRQSNEAERTLISRLPECLELLARTEEKDRKDIRVVLDKITQAQALDLERFGNSHVINSLTSPSELRNYTYLIAGSVGEFWTSLCFRHAVDFAQSSQEEMMRLGRSYGDGLQLINILRDAGSDLRGGRCYFPSDELAAAGLNPADIVKDGQKFLPVFNHWLEEAKRGLNDGLRYVGSIQNRRIRGATALPALIGTRTLALMRAAGPRVLEEKIKVPRQEVRAMIGTVVMTFGARNRLEAMFERLSR